MNDHKSLVMAFRHFVFSSGLIGFLLTFPLIAEAQVQYDIHIPGWRYEIAFEEVTDSAGAKECAMWLRESFDCLTPFDFELLRYRFDSKKDIPEELFMLLSSAHGYTPLFWSRIPLQELYNSQEDPE